MGKILRVLELRFFWYNWLVVCLENILFFFKNKKWNLNMLKLKVVKEFNFEMKEYVMIYFKKYIFGDIFVV